MYFFSCHFMNWLNLRWLQQICIYIKRNFSFKSKYSFVYIFAFFSFSFWIIICRKKSILFDQIRCVSEIRRWKLYDFISNKNEVWFLNQFEFEIIAFNLYQIRIRKMFELLVYEFICAWLCLNVFSLRISMRFIRLISD